MAHRQRTAIEAWVHQLQLEGSSTNGGIPPAARADKRLDAIESASVMVVLPTVANAPSVRENPKSLAESAHGYEPARHLGAQELPELLERSAEAARFAQLQILSAAEGRSSAADAAVAGAGGNFPRKEEASLRRAPVILRKGLQFASPSPAVPASPEITMSRDASPGVTIPFRDASFPVIDPVAVTSQSVAVTSPSCRTVPLVSSPNSPQGSAAIVPSSTPNRRAGQNFRQPSRFHRQPAAAIPTAKDLDMADIEGIVTNTVATSIPTMDLDGNDLNAEMLGMMSSGDATAVAGVGPSPFPDQILSDRVIMRRPHRHGHAGWGGGLDGSGSTAAAGVAASVGGSSDGGDPAPGASNSSADLAGGTQAQQASLVCQLPDSPAEGDWRPRTRTRFDAEAKERGVIKPRSMRERRRRDKISEGLQQLRRTLPAGEVGPQIDTAAMIEVAISHITHLQSQINSLESALLVQSMMEQRTNRQTKP
ncbi:unnamed protein product [Closterium sp. Yama58-4]|nr:unnamed protein product [Closterium sp. Yama58-4]